MAEGTKGGIGALVAVIAYLYGCFNEMLAVLAFFMIMDYIAGIVLAIKTGKVDYGIGIWGAIKKLLYGAIVIPGYLIDYTLTYTGKFISEDFSTKGGIGIAVILYLIGTEGLSIIKNLIELGLPVPPFLKEAFEKLNNDENKPT